jgi:hypothetical protein
MPRHAACFGEIKVTHEFIHASGNAIMNTVLAATFHCKKLFAGIPDQSRGSRKPNRGVCLSCFQAWRLPPLPREAPSHLHDPCRRTEQRHAPPATSSAKAVQEDIKRKQQTANGASPATSCRDVRARLRETQLRDARETSQHMPTGAILRHRNVLPHLMWTESQAFASRDRKPGRRRERCSFNALVHSFAVIMNVFTGCGSNSGGT